MKRIIALLLASLLVIFAMLPISVCAASEDTAALQAKFLDGVSTDGTDYVYYSPAKGILDTTYYPLIIFFHGEDVGLSKRSQIDKNGFINYASEAYQARFQGGGGCFLFAPRGKNGGWLDAKVTDVKANIDQFIRAHQSNIDTKRIYLIGYSRGADFLWKMLDGYPKFFAGAIPAAAIVQPDASVTGKLQNTAVWIFSSDNDTYYSANTINAREVFKNMKKATYNLESVRLTAFSNVLLPNGEFIPGSGLMLMPDTHSVWYAVTNDMHLNDGTPYPSNTTVDGMDHYIDIGYSTGVIDWLSQQTIEGAKSYDVPDEVRVPFRFLEFFLNFLRNLFSRFFGAAALIED